MKAKDYIIIGGAVALFLLWKNKTKKDSTSTIVGSSGTGTIAPTGTATPTTGGATAGTSQVTVLDTPPPSNEPEQVFGLGLPTGMDLPVLTAGTGVPTEVAVQLGGVRTNPTPALVGQPAFEIEESLILGGIKPIVKPIKANSLVYETTEIPSETSNIKEPIVVVSRPEPTIYLADQ
jgi:hypothetical protein